jgi:ornithine carbamoyltransferase
MEHFLTIDGLAGAEIRGLVERAAEHKAAGTKADAAHLLPRKTMAMIFDKPSLRTRLSFEVAMCQLGGHAVYLGLTTERVMG